VRPLVTPHEEERMNTDYSWLTGAAFVGTLLIVFVYRFGKSLVEDRRIEQRKAKHHRLLLDLGEARYKVAQIQAPPLGLVSAEDAGRLMSADGWAVVSSMPTIQRQRLAHHIDDIAKRVDRSLDRFLAHERGEVPADCVVYELERLRSYCRGFANEYSQPAGGTAAAKTRR
jgi:hypothetical protein